MLALIHRKNPTKISKGVVMCKAFEGALMILTVRVRVAQSCI